MLRWLRDILNRHYYDEDKLVITGELYAYHVQFSNQQSNYIYHVKVVACSEQQALEKAKQHAKYNKSMHDIDISIEQISNIGPIVIDSSMELLSNTKQQ